MAPRLKRWLTSRFTHADFITQQRAWVLLLLDLAAVMLAAIGATVGLLTGLIGPSSLAVWVAVAIVVSGGASILLLYLGRYHAAAQTTVVSFFIAVSVLNIGEVGTASSQFDLAYLATLIVLPALLLGIAWTIAYGAASLVVLVYVIFAHAGHVDIAPASAIAPVLAAIFLICVAVMISWVYGTAFQRVHTLLAAQQDYITALKEMSESLQSSEAHEREFYRDTIYSVTSGKLRICEEEELEPYLKSAEVRAQFDGPAQLHRARRAVTEYCADSGFAGNELEAFGIGVGEAITNAIKHGGGGIVCAGLMDDSIWVAVCDEGSGISSLVLPRALLMAGFSTKPSLGLGYTIMLDVADHILLKTSETGTTVVLIKDTAEDTSEPPEMYRGAIEGGL